MFEDETGWDEDTRRARRDAQLGGMGEDNRAPGWGPYLPPFTPDDNPLHDFRPRETPRDRVIRPTTFINPIKPPTGGGPPPAFQPPQPVVFSPPSGDGGGGGGGGGAPAPSQAVQAPAISNEVLEILRARLKKLSDPYDVQSDDIYQQQTGAYNLANTRDMARQRRVAAERAAAGGTRSSGGFDSIVRQIAARSGEQQKGFAAQLAGERLTAREQQLNIAIQVARQLGQDQVAMELENRRAALAEELGRGDLALRGELGRGQLSLGRDQLGLGYDQLGLGYGQLANSMNRDSILALLGGD